MTIVLRSRRSASRHSGRGGPPHSETRSGDKGCDCFNTLADIWFAGFAISFTVTRNMMYPYVVWSAWVEGPMAWRAQSLWGCTPDMDYMEMISTVMRMGIGWCMILLTVLQVLQLIWQYFLTKAIAKVLMGQELKDERSDSESDGKKDK